MRYAVFHRTRYQYGAPVRDNFNETRLTPLSEGAQQCRDFSLELDPPAPVSEFLDLYGNRFHQFHVVAPHETLSITAKSRVELSPAQPHGAQESSAPLGTRPPLPYPGGYFDFLGPSTFVSTEHPVKHEALRALAGERDSWRASLLLMRHVHQSLRYQPESTHVHTHMREVLARREGVCQDFAHVYLGLARSLGLAARYASGYLYNGPLDRLKGAQASHAWVEVYLPDWGWIGLDPTNDCVVTDRHIKIAHGRDYADIPPVKGSYRGTGERRLAVEVRVEDVGEG